ncbi:MAG: hypothetical protein IJU03_00980 [Thermoguttaceae bacterium]|nr:hypothetical protein [Thermoguttaceae bacterium]
MVSELMSLKEAAKYLNCTTTKLNDIAMGTMIPLKCTIVGRGRGFAKEDLDDWKARFDTLVADGKVNGKTFKSRQ